MLSVIGRIEQAPEYDQLWIADGDKGSYYDEESAPPTKEEFAIDFSLEFSPIKIPTAIDFLITYLKDAIDWGALQAVLEK